MTKTGLSHMPSCLHHFEPQLSNPSAHRARRALGVFIGSFSVTILLLLVGCGSPTDPPLPTAGVVAPSAHPLVATYTVTSPSAGSVNVEFGTDTSYGRVTGSQAVSAGGSVTVLVAGMRPQTAYHLRALVTLADGTTLADSDH